MTEPVDNRDKATTSAAAAELPEAESFRRGRLSVVWLIPLLALLVGVWLGYMT